MKITELGKLQQSNLAKLQALAAQGITLNASHLAIFKVEALVEFLVADEELEDYMLLVEQKKKNFIEEVMAEMRKIQLTQGVSSTLLRG